jgi:REP-associated tyrosine transposase
MMPSRLIRKNIRLELENYLGERQYFVTLCCARRRELLDRPGVSSWAIARLRQSAARHAFEVHSYCVMPDHLHLLAEGIRGSSNLLRFVAHYKQTTGFEFQQRWAQQLWQFKYFDHILRKSDALESVAWYIWLNPVRKGYCQGPREYPYSGFLTDVGGKIFSGSRRENWSPPWHNVSMTM